MTRRRRIGLIIAGALAMAGAGLMVMGRPILFRIVDPTEVTRNPVLVVANPLRDRAPEVAAANLLSDLRDRNLATAFARMGDSADQGVQQNETRYPIKAWRLIDRKDSGTTADLTYMVSRKTLPPVKTIVHLRMTRAGAEWIVSSFAPTY